MALTLDRVVGTLGAKVNKGTLTINTSSYGGANSIDIPSGYVIAFFRTDTGQSSSSYNPTLTITTTTVRTNIGNFGPTGSYAWLTTEPVTVSGEVTSYNYKRTIDVYWVKI